MAVFAGKFQRLLRKVRAKNVDRSGYRNLANGDGQKWCSPPRGFIPIYVGEERKRYLVPTAAANSPAFMEMLDEYQDVSSSGALSVPCSVEAFEHVLRRACDQTRWRL